MKIGDTVLVHNTPTFNGANVHPAIVNSVHGDRINVTVFPDMNDSYHIGSILPEGHVEYQSGEYFTPQDQSL
ncbi:hypothetical protein KAR91_47760 [Candidatus Pacearchaeota archaeon]|nr:hypothetical protein [Candidatus Pacearchaeota archaeon]